MLRRLRRHERSLESLSCCDGRVCGRSLHCWVRCRWRRWDKWYAHQTDICMCCGGRGDFVCEHEFESLSLLCSLRGCARASAGGEASENGTLKRSVALVRAKLCKQSRVTTISLAMGLVSVDNICLEFLLGIVTETRHSAVDRNCFCTCVWDRESDSKHEAGVSH